MYLNKGIVAMLVSPTNPMGIELYSSADILFWLKNMLIRSCHKAAILPWGTKKALFYHAKPHPYDFHCEA